MTQNDKLKLQKLAQEKGYNTAQKHIFLCTGDSCNSKEQSLEIWTHLKNRLKKDDPEKKIARSKTDCLRICENGTIALVYPEGVFYAELNKERLDQVIDQHLLGNKAVEEFCFFKLNSKNIQ